ncbi:hypothetical protein [Burkholderia sp. WSM2230]|uniref:hypothetical protein n=1 Tax=Burkholderia sp. WSM2230 TaxID=944435 RepID=UPI0003FBDABC|nr:hypothetical protein [Burkholderia sp. WSM2230]
MKSRRRFMFAACLFATLELLAYGSPVTDANRPIGPSDRPSSTITVVTATYGRNCGQEDGNATLDLGRRCDGRTACTYMLTGDIASAGIRSCRSDLVAQWRCGDGQTHAAALSAAAAPGDQLLLSCREFPGAGK